MFCIRRFLTFAMLVGASVMQIVGCGVTRSTDTMRTATEQLLISDAIDRAVQSMNLQPLSGQTVFLDDSKLSDTVDRNYFISTLRQQLLANGCDLQDKREDAEFIVEARAGAIGTDRNDLLFGIPSMNVPQIPLVQPVPAAIPEIPIAKRKDQRGVAKIAVFAYHRATGMPVWQSGIVRQESSANDVWIFGTGPFQHGTIYEGTEFAGTAIKSENSKNEVIPRRMPAVSVSQESVFNPPQRFAKEDKKGGRTSDPKVALASQQVAVPAAKPATTSTPATATTTPTSPAGIPTSQPTAAQAPVSAAVTGDTSPAPATDMAAIPATSGTPMIAPATPQSDPPKSPPVSSAYARIGDAAPLPQPRFNSPK